MYTHIWHIHLRTCLLCHLCEYRTYRGIDMKAHLKKKHADHEDEWVEPLPDLTDLR